MLMQSARCLSKHTLAYLKYNSNQICAVSLSPCRGSAVPSLPQRVPTAVQANSPFRNIASAATAHNLMARPDHSSLSNIQDVLVRHSHFGMFPTGTVLWPAHLHIRAAATPCIHLSITAIWYNKVTASTRRVCAVECVPLWLVLLSIILLMPALCRARCQLQLTHH